MNNDEKKRIFEMLEDRSEDFWGATNIDEKAWHKHLKDMSIHVVGKNKLCEAYDNKTPDTIMLEDPVGDCWLVIPKEVAEKFLTMGIP